MASCAGSCAERCIYNGSVWIGSVDHVQLHRADDLEIAVLFERGIITRVRNRPSFNLEIVYLEKSAQTAALLAPLLDVYLVVFFRTLSTVKSSPKWSFKGRDGGKREGERE